MFPEIRLLRMLKATQGVPARKHDRGRSEEQV